MVRPCFNKLEGTDPEIIIEGGARACAYGYMYLCTCAGVGPGRRAGRGARRGAAKSLGVADRK